LSQEQANPFTGAIGAEYELLSLICPLSVTLAGKLGRFLKGWRAEEPLRGFEIGCGTGVSTLALLSEREDLRLVSVDSSPKMLEQARRNLASFAEAGRVDFVLADALAALRETESASLDVVASNYATHNFTADYRRTVFSEILRTLKPGGLFLDGDRFAIDDGAAHLAHTQGELRHWFKTFAEINRYDLLEEWVVHLFSDESPAHIMYFTPTLQLLGEIGFAPVSVEWREGVDTLIVATKPV
jgi:tRNA (cmo5U34)-methyltransferase